MDRTYNYFDIEGGTQSLSGYAFPAVYKHEASGFYNWEEDNLPINDLETRSNVFRQYLGLGGAGAWWPNRDLQKHVLSEAGLCCCSGWGSEALYQNWWIQW